MLSILQRAQQPLRPVVPRLLELPHLQFDPILIQSDHRAVVKSRCAVEPSAANEKRVKKPPESASAEKVAQVLQCPPPNHRVLRPQCVDRRKPFRPNLRSLNRFTRAVKVVLCEPSRQATVEAEMLEMTLQLADGSLHH